jgi:catechol 2,3-dioxygenase-like lactoylglutathione lyase family enzyme
MPVNDDAPVPIVPHSGLSHVSLRVRDIERAIPWYQAVLGFEVLTNGYSPTPDRTRNAIGLIGAGSLVLELLEPPQGRRRDTETLGVAAIAVTVADIDVMVAAWNASPFGQQTPIVDAGPWRVAFLLDPDGNVVELVQQPDGAASMAVAAAWYSSSASS